MKIYNLVLALMLVVMMAGAVSAAAPTVSIGSVTLESDLVEKTVAFTAIDPDSGTMTYSVTSGSASVAYCQIPDPTVKSVKIIRGTDAITSTTPVTCTLQAVDNQSEASVPVTFTISVVPKSMLEIDRVNLILNGDSERLDDGEDFEAAVGDSLEFEIKIANLYTDDDDIEIENVEVTVDIEDWDDGDNEEFDSADDVDIKADDTETLTVSIDDIPGTISDGTHTITITVEGKDGETGFRHKATFTADMEIEKEDEDIQISSFSFEPSTVSCDRNIILNVRLENAGTDDSDEIVFTAKNSQLGISLQDYDIELDEGDSESMEYTIKISDSVEPGVYNIKLATYFDMDQYEDEEISTLKTAQITVVKCSEDTTPTTPVTPTTPEEEEEVVVVTPTTPTTPEQPAEEEQEVKTAFGISEKALIIGLVIMNLLLLIAIIVIIGKLLSM